MTKLNHKKMKRAKAADSNNILTQKLKNSSILTLYLWRQHALISPKANGIA